MNPRTSSNLKRCIFFFLPLTACKNHRVLHGRLARHVWREDSGNEEPFLTHPHIRIAVMQSTTACGRFRYHTNALIGRGGEGDVYSGIDLVSQRPMAIKVLKRATVGSLPPELAVLSDLTSHKHIVPAPIHAMCARTRRSILVSPLYLSDLHTAVECEPLSEVHVRGIMHQLLSALHHMHEAGVCHRDVKLENIFVRAGLCRRHHMRPHFSFVRVVFVVFLGIL